MVKDLDQVSRQFKSFAAKKCRNSCPLYERLSLEIAEDRELLALAAHAGDPVPNLFLAAVHFLLLMETDHPLAAFYPDISTLRSALPTTDSYPLFRSYCLDNKQNLTKIISERTVQTNEVGRCAYLFPAFCVISFLVSGQDLTVLEIGTSAGLNLLSDLYAYDYGGNYQYGELHSPVNIKSQLIGNRVPITNNSYLRITRRIGVDLNPLDINDPQDLLWLRALIWPSHIESFNLLTCALRVASTTKLVLRRGNAIELLPQIVSNLPRHKPLCIFHTHALYQFPEDEKAVFLRILTEYAQEKELLHLSCEWGPKHPELRLVHFSGQTRKEYLLAYCDLHGRWLRWVL
jgi:hypothetical protein